MNEKSKEQKLLELDRRIEKQKGITENQLRYELKKQGYLLKKSRVKNTNVDNLGGFMIVDANTNSIAAGSRYELNEHDVYRFIWESES